MEVGNRATTSRVACFPGTRCFEMACLGHDFFSPTNTFTSNHGVVVVIRFNSCSCCGTCLRRRISDTNASFKNTQRSTQKGFTRQRLRSTIRFVRETLDNDNDTHNSSTTARCHSTRDPSCNAGAKRNPHTLRSLALRLNRATIRLRRTTRHLSRRLVPTPNVLPSSL